MLILEHLERLARVTGLPISEIKSVKFGYEINWSAAAAYVLASCKIPSDVALLILRTECYVLNQAVGAPDYRYYQPPPSGSYYWITASDAGTAQQAILTNSSAPAQLVADCDELLLFQGGRYANLLSALGAPPDAYARTIRTTVFGYFVPSAVVDLFSAPETFINVQM